MRGKSNLGGGTKGAYQAGVFEAMVKLLKPEDVAYDVMTGKPIHDRAGASVGALNGLMLAAHEKGTEVEVARKMTELWKTVEQESIFVQWPILGPVLGLISKSSFFDNSPELPYLRTRLKAEGGQIKRRMTIGIADAQTGDYLVINSSTGAKDWPLHIVGSSSVPGFFIPMVVGDRVWVDGGTLNNLNLRGGIAECHDIGAKDEDIVIDVVMTNPCIPPNDGIVDAPHYDMSEAKTYDVYQRGVSLGSKL